MDSKTFWTEQMPNAIIGNLKMKIDDGKKKALFPNTWKIDKRQKIHGDNLFVRMGKISDLSCLDVDIKNGKDALNNLLDIGIDMNDYKDDCIVVKTPSGGYHYIFSYTKEFKTGVNSYCVQGLDICNDGKIIYSGKGYDILSIPKQLKSIPDEILLRLEQNKQYEDNKKYKNLDSDTSTEKSFVDETEYSQKYYDLLNLLDDKWFNDYSKWSNIVIALYNCEDISKSVAINTYLKLIQERSDENYEKYKKEAVDYFNKLDTKTCSKKYTMGSIKKIVGGASTHDYKTWRDIYEPMVYKGSKKNNKPNDEKDDMILQIKEIFKQLDPLKIYEHNELEFDNILQYKNKSIEINELCNLLISTFVKINKQSEYYYMVKDENNKFVPLYNYNGMKTYDLIVFDEENDSEVVLSLLDVIHHVEEYVTYKKVMFEPYDIRDGIKLTKHFNLFTGFKHPYQKDFIVNMNIVNVFTNHIKTVFANNDMVVFNYINNYFAHILQKPHIKTGVVLNIKGDHGCGKTSPFQMLSKWVIGNVGYVKINDIKKATGKFNSIMQSKLLVLFEEAINISDKKDVNMLKDMITSDKMNIEYKGKEPIEIDDYCNYAIASNDDFSTVIQSNDRRYLCVECNDIYMGDFEYFNNFYDVLNNDEAGKHLFHYYMNLNLDSFNIKTIPETEYKKELKRKAVGSDMMFFIDIATQDNCLDEFREEDKEYEYEYKASMLYTLYKEYCDQNGLKYKNNKVFGVVCTKELKISKIKKRDGLYYTFNQSHLINTLDQYIV